MLSFFESECSEGKEADNSTTFVGGVNPAACVVDLWQLLEESSCGQDGV